MAQTKKTKKPVKKAATKVVAAAAAPTKKVVEKMETCPCCHHRCLKHFITFLFGALVGAAACCFACGPHGRMMMNGFMHHKPVFVNGCLDTSKIGCPEKLEKVQLKDANKDGCITEDEFFGPRGPKGPEAAPAAAPAPAPEDQPRPMMRRSHPRM